MGMESTHFKVTRSNLAQTLGSGKKKSIIIGNCLA